MIPRYSRPEMTHIWQPDYKFRIWMDIEALASEAQEQLGQVPKGVAAAIRQRGGFDVDRMAEIEAEVKHDVIAFLTNLGEHVGDSEAAYIHQGLTSSDVIDTGFSVQLKHAGELLLAGMDRVLDALRKHALEHQNTLCIGRSHGIHAEPTTFGLKLAGHYAAFKRHRKRLERAIEAISICAISGAVGTFATIDPFVQKYVAQELGLTEETISTQIIPRDRHAEFISVLALIAASIENLATEIRHLQRTEVREVEEYFEAGQKGSSAMPHKRNPVLSENLTGLARMVRSAIIPALENVTLWHERDISHSSTERMIMPDACITLDFALHRLAGVIEKLIVYPDRMRSNMEALGGLVFSQKVMLALTQSGMSREAAYRIIQRHAMQVWDSLEHGRATIQFLDLLSQDPEITPHISPKALQDLFSYQSFTRHIPELIKKSLT